MTDQGLLLAYYFDREEAAAAIQELRRRRFRRAASIYKSPEGTFRIDNRSRWTWTALGLVTGLLVGGSLGLLVVRAGLIRVGLPAEVAQGLLALAGLIIGGLAVLGTGAGVDRAVLEQYIRWAVADETVLVIQDRAVRLGQAIPILRRTGEEQPSLFVFQPSPRYALTGEPPQNIPVPDAQLHQHAVLLAAEHTLQAAPGRRGGFLRRLADAEAVIDSVCQDLAEAGRLEQGITSSAEWILDNAYVIRGHIHDVRQNLPEAYYRQLPILADGPHKGLPRIHGLARELILHTDARLDRRTISSFLAAYQSASPLRIGELWAVPLMLRVALIESLRALAEGVDRRLREREQADFWAHRLLATARREPGGLFRVLAELAHQQPSPSASLAAQLTGQLYDEEAARVPVQSWLERTLRSPLGDLVLKEQARRAAYQISIGNAITSLRELALLDWRQVFEAQSRVEQVLLTDPAGVYPHMDFETRDSYRQAVETIAAGGRATEEAAAQSAIDLASEDLRTTSHQPSRGHVGVYLIGEGRPRLVERLGGREARRYRALQWVYRHPTSIYLSSVTSLTTLAVASTLGLWMASGERSIERLVLGGLVALLPGSQLGLEILNYLVTRLVPPRTLPKMDFKEEGIPDAFRTLVVVPMILADPRTAQEAVDKLEIRYLANPQANLVFSLFSDFADSPTPEAEGDAALLLLVDEGLQSLNRRYGADRFYLFHRAREWSESEGGFIGWERKRGKLEELNHLLTGEPTRQPGSLVRVGDPDRLADIAFVITLDSDTQLPRDSARRMIETLAHPLNRADQRPQAAGALGAYAVIQPRISTALPSATASSFSRLFTDPVGSDPYTKAVSDVYQDLSGEGSYHGKGIYDVRAFARALSNRFPEAWLLSHDLLEGAHVRVGLASDIELFDDFPSDYRAYTGRQHRWIRGDWQIIDWLLPRVPAPGGRRVPNPLSWLSRWKIFDNLRRSLLPGGIVVFLMAAWLLSPALAAIAAGLTALLLFFQPLARPITLATSRPTAARFSWREVAHDLARSIVEAALLPHQTGLALDAIGRVWYRRLVSRRKLLEWTTARMALWNAPRPRSFLVPLLVISLLSAGLAVVLGRQAPGGLPLAIPFLTLWFLSPWIGWRLTGRRAPRRKARRMPQATRRRLGALARRTWRYFDDFVGEASAWLPPDNFQVSHQNSLALRTSPTNIGLWTLSALAAVDFGYLTGDQMIHRVGQTFHTLDRLERFEGHLLNWYDLGTLRPLEPRYLSSVDSGNLLYSLWTLVRGTLALMDAPVVGPQIFTGLQDTLAVLREEGAAGGRDEASGLLAALEDVCFSTPDEAGDIIGRLRRAAGQAEALASRWAGSEAPDREPSYWASQIARQVADWVQTIDRYLGWVEILAAEPEAQLARIGPPAVEARRLALARSPSLRELATGDVAAIQALRAALDTPAEAPAPDLAGRLQEALASFDKAKWLAGEVLAEAEGLIQKASRLGEEINLRFLYDPQRRLFAVGYNVEAQRLDGSFYDLLASESRLGSFVAIARGDVPGEHWLALNRPFGSVEGRAALLSWTGTMFEYLMPLLVQRTFDNSLLDDAARQAVAVQQAYGRRRGVPWGMSESAYSDLDIHKTYQYKAFGVPGLGLKRGLADDLVVAPYATLLALAVDPEASVRNLQRLVRLGLQGGYGLYESIDFSRQRRREGGRGVLVRAYMAHHQAMEFLALDNFLHDGVMWRRFHSDPRVRASEPLLYERIPTVPAAYHTHARELPPSRITEAVQAPSVSKFETPHTPTPKTQLLSNGNYSLMVTNAGGGYSQWKSFDLTRWRADTTRDAWGTFCYIRDTDSGKVWSNAYHPVEADPDSYTVNFSVDRAEIKRSEGGVETDTEIVVSPEDDVEVRRITLINRTVRRRHLEITSYVELAMASHAADRQHPAFHKLFVQTEAVTQKGVLLAHRRPRGPDEPGLVVAHRLTFEGDYAFAAQFETDRRSFLGRGGTWANPAALRGPLSNQAGYVLDPVLSLRRAVQLEPGGRARFTLVLAAAEGREGALRLAEKYSDPRAIGRALELAWAHSQLELRLLRIQPDEARRFQALASHLLYPNAQLRPPPERLRQNRRGQSALWPYGLSGDLPIAVVSIDDARDIGLIRQMLQAHTYWRQHGLKADLVILNEESSSYEQPLNERLTNMVQAHAMYTGVDQPGGIFLRTVDQIPEQDLTLILSAARISLIAARGALAQQLGVAAPGNHLAASLPTRSVKEEPSAQLPFLELPYFNGLGGFTQDGKEYAVYLGPGSHTPAPWINVIANPRFGTLVSESGAGFTWSGNSQRYRLTEWSNDPVSDPPSEAIYLTDLDSGVSWTPTAGPIREKDAYRARHGAGYTVFEHNSHAIEQEMVTFVPVDDQGGDPLRVQRLRLRNDSSKTRRLAVTFYVEWTLGEDRERAQSHVETVWDEDAKALLAANRYHPDYSDRLAFATLSPAPQAYTADRAEFLGRNQDLARPAALKRLRLLGRSGPGLDPCAALQVSLDLAPGQTREVTCLLGQADSLEEAQRLVSRYREAVEVQVAFERTRQWWDDRLGRIQVDLPDLSVNFLLNRWLVYQSLSCRLWARTAFYQSSGAYGFRDQLQDVMALVYAAPDIARQHILLAAGRQFVEGDVQHWWHPPSGEGTRTRISDDLLWLPYVIAHYVETTGDSSILEEKIPFLQAPLLGEAAEAFLAPDETLERASLYDHARRAVERGLTAGRHGLPLMGSGDWNDAMNRVGIEGQGESVWLAWFLADVLNAFAGVAERSGHLDHAAEYRQQAGRLAEAVEREAWDGNWYLRAFFDDGSPLGSAASDEGRIDSLPQSWAALSGEADPARQARALDSAWENLVREDEGLTLLLTPPFDRTPLDPGYIKGYPPGVRENGGQYTHAAVWLAAAYARSGDGDRAVRLLRMLNPVEHARDPLAVAKYQVEPYVVAADVYRLAGSEGRGGWTWYTGSAAWMYRVWIEDVLGFRLRGQTLRLDPVLPKDWKGFRLRYAHGEAVYDITVENPEGVGRGVAWVEMDGRRLEGLSIPLEDGAIKHKVRVRMGEPLA